MGLNQTFKALSAPTRRKILKLLKKRDMSAGEIASYFKISLPSLSHHFNSLKSADLVTVRRDGQQQIYSLKISVFEEIVNEYFKYFK